MIGTGVFRYAGIHARVRARYSYLISGADWTELINSADLSALIALLRRSVYGSYITQLDDAALTPKRAVNQIELQLADSFTTLLRAAPGYIRPLLTLVYNNYEVNNLKAVLRGLLARASWEQVREVLFPLGDFTVLPAEAMVETHSVPAAVELLRGTAYYITLSNAMERFSAEQRLFPLEVALDLAYWREIWNGINRLPKQDRFQALRTVGSLLDVNNLLWAIRYRVYYNFSEEEVINYTLPFGYQVRDADIRAIAAGEDIVRVVSRIYPRMSNAASLLSDPRLGLPELEVRLLRYVMERCRKAFIGYPFHIGIPLAFLVLKKMEIQVLTALIEAKSSRKNVEEFRPYLTIGIPVK
jgi:vacuolar-type H+-ATPase subunit C/Vma6